MRTFNGTKGKIEFGNKNRSWQDIRAFNRIKVKTEIDNRNRGPNEAA